MQNTTPVTIATMVITSTDATITYRFRSVNIIRLYTV